MKKTLTFLLLLVFLATSILAATGCQSTATTPEPVEDNHADDTEPATEPIRVALLMSGPISDQGWNAMAYQGLLAVQEDHGAEIAFSESVSQSDMEEVFRGYAQSGFDVVFGHGFEFQDAAFRVAEEYHETIFILTSNTNFQDPNLGSVTDNGFEKGFLAGVVAGVASESGTVGFIGGMEIPPIRAGMDGFEAGAKYVNPDTNVLTTFIGNFEDAGAAKELALAMIDSGADVVMAQADSASLGTIEAVVEQNIKGIGINADQSSLAPDNMLTSSLAGYNVAMSLVVGSIIDGTWVPSGQVMGVAEGVNGLAPYHQALSAEQIARIEEVREDIASGRLNVRDL